MRDEWVHVGRLWSNGEQFLAIDSAGRGDWRGYSNPFQQARPGPMPAEHGWPSGGVDPGLLISTDGVTAYRLKVRWFTEPDEESCFARWLLIPVAAGR